MLSTAHNFLFIHVPKTAGNSIQRCLLTHSEDEMVLRGGHQDGIERFEISSPTLKTRKHSTLSEYKAQLPPAQFEGLFKFFGVRNPWERCASFFVSPHRGTVDWSEQAFNAFIDTSIEPVHWYLQTGATDPTPFRNADAVIRFEHLAEDFELICQKIGLPTFELPRVNASTRKDYRAYYTNDALIDQVAKKFAREIECFQYRFDPT